MDDVFAFGEVAWDLVREKSRFLLRKKYTPSLKGNPERFCYVLFFICGLSSVAGWFSAVSSLLYYSAGYGVHFLYYLSAYSFGMLPVLALHKTYEQNMAKRDFPKASFLLRMSAVSIYGIVVCLLFAMFAFETLYNTLFLLGLGVSHGALLGGLAQIACVFPAPCYGYLLFGVDLAGIVPFIFAIILAITKTTSSNNLMAFLLFVIPAVLSFVGGISLLVLLRSETGSEYLGLSSSKNSGEAAQSLLSPSPDQQDSNQYISLSSFVTYTPTSFYKAPLAWGLPVFACSFCTYFMMPFFLRDTKSGGSYFPVILFFVMHFSNILGRELLCGFLKSAVKGKAVMWILVLLRGLIIGGWIAEVVFFPGNTWQWAAVEVAALVLCGMVGGAVNPAVYMLAGMSVSDNTRDAVKAMYVCMWSSIAGALSALAILNTLAFLKSDIFVNPGSSI